MALIQYLKDTRGELNHVAWPTRVQTIVFTFLVIAISVFISLYLGLSDYLLTNGLGQLVERFPGASQPAPFEIQDIQTEPVPAEDSVDIDTIIPSDN